MEASSELGSTPILLMVILLSPSRSGPKDCGLLMIERVEEQVEGPRGGTGLDLVDVLLPMKGRASLIVWIVDLLLFRSFSTLLVPSESLFGTGWSVDLSKVLSHWL